MTPPPATKTTTTVTTKTTDVKLKCSERRKFIKAVLKLKKISNNTTGLVKESERYDGIKGKKKKITTIFMQMGIRKIRAECNK